MRFFKHFSIGTVLILLLFSLNSCKGENPTNEVDSGTNASADTTDSYPAVSGENTTLEPSTEELIDPGFAGERTTSNSQDMEAYPSISGESDFTYPGMLDEGLYPYPSSDFDDEYSYPEPEDDSNQNSQLLPELDQPSATPTSTLAPLATNEPLPTSTPEGVVTPSPTFTLTPSPTILPTATPLPLFVDRSLRASDPTLLKLSSGKVQLIEFFAFWDASSKALAPMMNQLKLDFGKTVIFHFLDIDDPATRNIKKQLGFRVQPHLILLDGKGNILEEWTGFVDEAELRDELTRALQR